MSQKPSLGRILIYTVSEFDKTTLGIHNNGADQCPSIITRVWGDTPGSAVNLLLFPDNSTPVVKTSVRIGDDGEEAKPGEARWPSRV